MTPSNCRKDELSIQDGCVLWGSRVVVPKKGQPKVLDRLHQGHPGMARMKSLARSIVWWPGIDADITSKIQGCRQCQEKQKSPPEQPWSQLHVDHARPFLSKTFLLVVDAHSKWLEVMVVPSTPYFPLMGSQRCWFQIMRPALQAQNSRNFWLAMEFVTLLVLLIIPLQMDLQKEQYKPSKRE